MTTILIVAVLSLVQSLFGVGILVFGTPTLLLLGHSFTEALSILLPASAAISLLQVWTSTRPDGAFVRQFAMWCLLPLAAGLATVILIGSRLKLEAAVAILLVVFVALRLQPRFAIRTQCWVRRHQSLWLLLMGIVHGVSNLGGALLLVFATSRAQRKEDVRGTVAFCYAAFAVVQLCVLAFLSSGVFGWPQLLYAGIASSVLLTAGRWAFEWITLPVFDRLLTILAAGYAVVLGLRAVGASL